jgi:hypothetical protein
MLFEAMFLNPPGTHDSNILLIGLPLLGTIIGLALIRRAAGEDPDREPSSWRYRQVDAIRPAADRDGLPTIGWIATRLAMSVTVGVLVFVLLAPVLLEGFGFTAAYAPWLWLMAIGLAAAGTLWIFRIAWRGPEAGATAWRYRRKL